MTRMIERWFPCKEVSENSAAGWGSGNTERSLFTWFAARPTAQAKAAVICSLLPWPDDEAEQKRLQELVKRAMTGRYAARDELRDEILKANPEGASMLDPFSGRGMIPLEAARLGIESHAVELSPVAVLASHLLTDYPFRDWRGEPELPFGNRKAGDPEMIPALSEESAADRYYRDVKAVLDEVGRRHAESMQEFYPMVKGRQPWGYLWAVTLPCQECGRRFPLVGSYSLRLASSKKATKAREAFDDPGQSFYIDADSKTGEFAAVVHEGSPRHTPTLANAVSGGKKARGKSAVCPFCSHTHPLETHKRLAFEGKGQDALLVVADHDDTLGKRFREPTAVEVHAADAAVAALANEPEFSPFLTALPDEQIPEGDGHTIRPLTYGAKTFGDLMIPRQGLAFTRLARSIDALVPELLDAGLSDEYVRALTAYAAAQLARQLRRSTRGATLDVARQGSHDIFVNESTIAFSHDNLEPGIGRGPGTWDSMVGGGLSTLRNLLDEIKGSPTDVVHGSATSVPMKDHSLAVVVTDPPYDAMVYYSDSSDLMYAWLKRALHSSWPELALTPDPRGLQDKSQEIIVKLEPLPGEHRNMQHYDSLISQAFAEMRRVVRNDGVVTIVFGHGDPKVWQRLLGAISGAGLVLTGSWPANTEAGGQQGAANIKTTLTMACRPAAPSRPEGLKAQVESEVKAEVTRRIDLWERSGLAPTDMLMASAGPAMEVVGRYSQVVDVYGDPVDPGEFLVVARRAVRENAHIEIDHHPLDTFDARTRFALWWVRLFGKDETAKSELRWQTLADELDLAEVRDLVPDTKKGVRFTSAAKTESDITPDSAVIDLALAMAKAWPEGAGGVGQVLAAADKESDPYLWAAVTFLADRLPDSDPDAIAFTGIVRARGAVTAAAKGVHIADEKQRLADEQPTLDFSGER